MLDALRARGIPAAVVMAGGYGRDLATTVDIQRRTLELACASWQGWQGWQTRPQPAPECAA